VQWFGHYDIKFARWQHSLGHRARFAVRFTAVIIVHFLVDICVVVHARVRPVLTIFQSQGVRAALPRGTRDVTDPIHIKCLH